MKIAGKVVQAAFLGGVLLTGAGCVTRGTIKKQMTNLCEQHKYQDARNFDVDVDKIFFKNDLIENVVNPHEIAYRHSQLDSAVNGYVAKNNYTGARNYIWDYQFDSVQEVSDDVKAYGYQLLTQTVNVSQFQYCEPLMRQKVQELLDQNQYAEARKFLAEFPAAKVYANALDVSLDAIQQALLAQQVGDDKVNPLIASSQASLAEIFEDMENEALFKETAGEHKVDLTKFNEWLDAFRQRVIAYGADEAKAEELCKTIRENAEELANELYRPAEQTADGYHALGTTALNQKLDDLKNELTKSINEQEIQFRNADLSAQVSAALDALEFDKARDIALAYSLSASEDASVRDAVNAFGRTLIREQVNPRQLQNCAPIMRQKTQDFLAKNQFADARKYLNDYPAARVYAQALENILDAIRKSLVDQKVAEDKVEPVLTFARDFLAKMVADLYNDLNNETALIRKAGSDSQPSMARFDECLKELQRGMESYGASEEKTSELCGQIRSDAEKLARELYSPAEDFEDGFTILGTGALNKQLCALKLELKKVINAQEIVFRSDDLRKKVNAALDAKDYGKARDIIYTYGVVDCEEVDKAIFTLKCALLNSYVNPGYLAAETAARTAKVQQLIAEKKFDEADKEAGAILPVRAYPVQADEVLEAALQTALKQRVDEEKGRLTIDDTIAGLYEKIAKRGGCDLLEPVDFTPDWSEVTQYLEAAKAVLVADDLGVACAKELVDGILESFKGNLRPAKTAGELITFDLNLQLNTLRDDLKRQVADALQKEIEAEMARQAEEARKAAELQAQAEKDAAARKAQAKKEALEQLKQVRQGMIADALAAVNMDSKIAQLTVNLPACTPADIVKIAADAARALRLLSNGKAITPGLANSLFVAAIYLGEENLAKLAVLHDADINAPSPKDPLKRAALLIALQYGFNPVTANYLKDANLNVRDANGATVYHYAIRAFNTCAFQKFYKEGISLKAADAQGTTPLMLACRLGYVEFVKAILADSDLNAQDAQGDTALLIAARRGSLELVRLLADSKADIALRNAAGMDLLDVVMNLTLVKGDGALLDYLFDTLKIAPTEAWAKTVIANRASMSLLAKMIRHGLPANDALLVFALESRNESAVEALVEMGLDLDQPAVLAVLATYTLPKTEKAILKALDTIGAQELVPALKAIDNAELLKSLEPLNDAELQKALAEKLDLVIYQIKITLSKPGQDPKDTEKLLEALNAFSGSDLLGALKTLSGKNLPKALQTLDDNAVLEAAKSVIQKRAASERAILAYLASQGLK
jgi:hypothetical protein